MRLSGMCLSVLLMFASMPCFAQEPTESDIATMYPLSPVVTHGVSPSTPDALGYEYKGTTDRGVVRSKNEDSFWIDGANGVFLVADGMGGHEAGEVASTMAAETLRQWSRATWVAAASNVLPLSRTMWTLAAYHAANARIFDKSSQKPSKRGMGTTLVSAIVYGRSFDIINVGDSRAYLYRGGKLTQISKDHSLLQAYIDKGMLKTPEEIRSFPYKNVITQAMGTQAKIEPDVYAIHASRGDIVILCSDGVTDELEDGEMAQIITEHGRDVNKSMQEIVRIAKQRGGYDNITLVLVGFHS